MGGSVNAALEPWCRPGRWSLYLGGVPICSPRRHHFRARPIWRYSLLLLLRSPLPTSAHAHTRRNVYVSHRYGLHILGAVDQARQALCLSSSLTKNLQTIILPQPCAPPPTQLCDYCEYPLRTRDGDEDEGGADLAAADRLIFDERVLCLVSCIKHSPPPSGPETHESCGSGGGAHLKGPVHPVPPASLFCFLLYSLPHVPASCECARPAGHEERAGPCFAFSYSPPVSFRLLSSVVDKPFTGSGTGARSVLGPFRCDPTEAFLVPVQRDGICSSL